MPPLLRAALALAVTLLPRIAAAAPPDLRVPDPHVIVIAASTASAWQQRDPHAWHRADTQNPALVWQQVDMHRWHDTTTPLPATASFDRELDAGE
jgi:hypothetical protein